MLSSPSTKWLWITLHDPLPAINGQYIYSDGLMRAVAATGTKIDAIAIAREDGLHRDGEEDGGISWRLAPVEERGHWERAFSALPWSAFRWATPGMHAAVEKALGETAYDVVVLDSICVGWALDLIEARRTGGTKPAILHIAHNHERTVARRMRAQERRPLQWLAKTLEVLKVAALEKKLFTCSDVATSNTPEDRAQFQSEYPESHIELLRPSYDGPRVPMRAIDADTARRAVIVGSFDWQAKRVSLEDFLRAAAPVFEQERIELQVVGNAEEGYLSGLRAQYPSVAFTGRVDDVKVYLKDARVALVPDYFGGFKLKSLDYVFHRVPIFGLDGAVPGLPLTDGTSVRLFPDHAALAQGVVERIDDFPTLNRQHEAAYGACESAFDLQAIGEGLVKGVRLDSETAGADVTPSRAPEATSLLAAS